MRRLLVGGCVLAVALACGGGERGAPDLCSSTALYEVLSASDSRVTSVSHFACADGHAFARGTYDCDGCVPESIFFLAEEADGWTVIGSSQSMDPALCEESRRMSFDDCGAMFTASGI